LNRILSKLVWNQAPCLVFLCLFCFDLLVCLFNQLLMMQKTWLQKQRRNLYCELWVSRVLHFTTWRAISRLLPIFYLLNSSFFPEHFLS
jgi:hypothetical protein